MKGRRAGKEEVSQSRFLIRGMRTEGTLGTLTRGTSGVKTENRYSVVEWGVSHEARVVDPLVFPGP